MTLILQEGFSLPLNSFRKKPDFDPDLHEDTRVKLSRRQYQIYYYLTKKHWSQKQIADKLHITKQSVNEHVKNLKILGVIKQIKKASYPKFYKSTPTIPTTLFGERKNGSIVISQGAKKPERRVGKPYKTVRDRKTGRFKGRRRGRAERYHRDYDTVISVDGKRVPVLRVHSLAYTCTLLREPVEHVPWEKKDAPNGMEQWVLRHTFSNKKSEIDELRELEVTFVRQKTKSYDELVIYMPEKYVFEHELRATEKIMEEYVWVARKWFQNRFKTWLSLAIPYRKMEIAREIFDPALKRFVQEEGMVKVKTRGGFAMVDESQKGFPEKEFTSIDEVEVDLHASERILALEQMMTQLVETQRKTNEMINKMAESQKEFVETVSKMVGIGVKVDTERIKENQERGMF